MDHLCLVFVMISSLLITALWSAAEKRLTDWPSSVAFICICVTFLCSILGQVWYLIVSTHDLCTFLTFIIR